MVRSTTALVALLVVAQACTDDPAIPRSDGVALTDDVAQLSAEAALADLESIEASAAAAGRRGAGDPGDGESRRFPAGAVFYDADGSIMEGYDPLLTEAVTWSSTRDVEVDRGAVSGSISRSRSMTISGLAGEEAERTHDGEGTDARSRVVVRDGADTRSYDFSSRVVIEGVVHAVDREARPWPLSGTITRNVELRVVNGRNGDRDASRTSVLSFDGTRFATLVVDGETFTVDLAERQGRMVTREGPGGR